jgi:hypothetical protein
VASRFTKKSSAPMSAVDQLALARAQEILAENGIELEAEKTASEQEVTPADVLRNAVEERAVAMLQAAGYEFES